MDIGIFAEESKDVEAQHTLGADSGLANDQCGLIENKGVGTTIDHGFGPCGNKTEVEEQSAVSAW